jgi:hypothetical protein
MATILQINSSVEITSVNEGLGMSRDTNTPSSPKPLSKRLSLADDETCKTIQLAQDLIRALDAESEEHMSHISAADKQGRTEEASG